MELADDIAYGVHDLEDAIALRLIGQERLMEMWASHAPMIGGLKGVPTKDEIEELFGDGSLRKRAIGTLVNFFIIHVHITRQGLFAHPLLDFQVVMDHAAERLLSALSTLVRDEVIRQPTIQMLEYRGQRIVQRIFEAIAEDPERFLTRTFLQTWRCASDKAAKMRAVCDYVAGMTDEYAIRIYERMFVPRTGNAFGRF
jgi:dGTPase